MDGDVVTDFNEKMSSFHCLFTSDPPRTRDKIKSIKIKLNNELETDVDSGEEIIEKLNFCTWIEFKLGNYDAAKKHNQVVLKMTRGKNITALINQAHVFLCEGDEGSAEERVDNAEKLMKSCEGEQLMIAAEAELAYSLSRLGGGDYLRRAFEIYLTVVKKQPEKYVWKFGLGLLLRRATHVNVTIYMNSKMSISEQAQLAFYLLKDVADKSQDTCLKGRAFAQLAVMVWQSKCFLADPSIFGGVTFEQFIDEALTYASNDAWTLTECGRILWFFNLSKATRLLEQARGIREHSTTLHHLGNCYLQKAKNKVAQKANKKKQKIKNNQRGNMTQNPINMRSPVKEIPLNKHTSMVAKAIQCYDKAIKISFGNNIPAQYSLGRILRACGENDEALVQFNQIIFHTSKKCGPGSNRMERQEHIQYLLTTTCAYEQCAYCLLDLACLPGKTKQEVYKLNKKSEQKLLQAISLTATLSNLDPEMKCYEKQIFNAFTTLESQYEEMKESPKIIKKYIELLKRACKYEKIPEVIEKLRHLSVAELADPMVIKTALESYLALKQYEAAFAFLTFPMINQSCSGQLLVLASIVNLYTAASRLQAFDSSAKFILKPLFDSCFEKAPSNFPAADQPQANDNTECVQDDDFTNVLIMFDGNVESSADVSETVKILQEIISGEFGLDVSNIDEILTPGRIKLNQQLREIERARTVLILLNGKSLTSLFKSLLEFIPTLKMECSKRGKSGPHIVLGLKDDSVEVPQILMAYAKINLGSLLHRIQDFSKDENNEDTITDSQCSGTMAASYDVKKTQQFNSEMDTATSSASRPDDVNDVQAPQGSSDAFDDCTTAKMSIYCALIGKEWPL